MEPFVAFDTDTTGIGKHDRIVSAAIIEFHNGQPAATHEWLINPEIPIPAAATRVHGITTEYARRHGQDEQTGIAAMADMLAGRLVVAYNASFDMRMLHQRLDAYELPYPEVTVHDPMRWFREDQKTGPHKLANACTHYGVVLDNWHDATADALAAGHVAVAQCGGASVWHG